MVCTNKMKTENLILWEKFQNEISKS